MAGPPGIAYVYLVYGMYDCLNVVTGPEGAAAAVLIRAVEPLTGMAAMRNDRLRVERRRRAVRHGDGERIAAARLARTPDAALARGPGLVGAAFGIDVSWTGTDLCDARSTVRLEVDPAGPADAARIVATPRIGVAYAGPEWAGRPWRFALAGHPSVSRAR